MTDGDGLHHEMRHLPRPEFGSDPLALDEGTAERLLAGRLDPADAPPPYVRAAMVLEAAAAPPGADDLAGEAQAVAALAAVARSNPPPSAPSRRSPPVLTKALSLKFAIAATIAAMSLGSVAFAATNALPAPAQRVAHRMLGAAGVPSPDDASAAHGSGPVAHSSTGPDPTGAARDGLCRAWQSGQGGEQGRRNDSTAFKALARAAGGADKVAAFCHDTTANGNGNGKAAPPSSGQGEGQGQGHDDEHAGDPGQGSGQGSGQDHSQSAQPPAKPGDRD